MAEQAKSNGIASIFPNPPPFWQHFTVANVRHIEKLHAAQLGVERNQESILDPCPPRLLDLPAELRFLQAPEPPAHGRYRCFGDIYNLNESLPSLAEQNIKQLYTPPVSPSGTQQADRAFILKRLAKSLILNFLELLGIMSINPEHHIEKISDIRTIFINFHHLLNEYRPHQARESLILMMRDQLDRTNAETEGIMKMKVEVESQLNGLEKIEYLPGDREEDVEAVSSGEEDRETWDLLDREFG